MLHENDSIKKACGSKTHLNRRLIMFQQLMLLRFS